MEGESSDIGAFPLIFYKNFVMRIFEIRQTNARKARKILCFQFLNSKNGSPSADVLGWVNKINFLQKVK